MSNNSQIAFAPLGETIVVPAAATAPAGVQALVNARLEGQAAGQYRIVNTSVNTVFLGVGTTAASATANAVEPISGNPSPAIVLLAGAIEILRFTNTAYFSGLASGASTVYITPGQGL